MHKLSSRYPIGLAGGGAFVLAAAGYLYEAMLWFVEHTAEHKFFERINEVIPWADFVIWGPPLALLGVGAWLFRWAVKSKGAATTPVVAAQPQAASNEPDLVAIHKAVAHAAKVRGEWPGATQEEKTFENARIAIRQAALDGGVQIRGKLQTVKRDVDPVYSDVWVAIPKDYWKDHKLTVAAAVDHAWALLREHTMQDRPSADPTIYAFLEVAWSAVLQRWPEPAPPNSLMRLDDVLKHIVGRVAGCEDVERACTKLRELALHETISVFGGIEWRKTKPADYDRLVRDPIPAQFWRKHRIVAQGVLGKDDPRGHTESVPASLAYPIYYGIWFKTDQIKAL